MYICRHLTMLPLLAAVLIVPSQSLAFEPQKIAKLEEKIYRGTETVMIGNQRYDVPYPWRGNRIPAPTIAPSKFRQIPLEHTDDNSRIYVTSDAHSALLNLFAKAKQDGIHLRVASGYRSPDYQRKIFLRKFKEGRTFEDVIRYVAPPGYSQHALGTCVDFAPSNWRFANKEDYNWLRDNAAAFGFTETYPQRNEYNYPWESWHWNYSANNLPHIRDNIDIKPENRKKKRLNILAEQHLEKIRKLPRASSEDA